MTALRLALSVVLFVVLAIAQSLDPDHATRQSQLYLAAFILFVIAAGTDWVDGFYARHYDQVTVLGRIFDPFVDKVIICGVFIFLVASPGSQITAWMAVVVVVRELLVTALRSFFERRGTDFSAKWAGKVKMVLQCGAAAASLLLLTYTRPDTQPAPAWLLNLVIVLLWSAIVVTVYSGAEYVVAAARLWKD
ncbi:MAG: CDP-diacylglycerol--glycerol-3-phosphate 3-phosphatidyltransferase [Planctomycetales bacterium]|nr:CDP-diacylglycerol--glycerol-3-phosphate 3-phosphatidyltransferase [Planctomycetales bacterium]